ncbi:unnamed protein product, partial [Effrenium voratum]
PAPGELLETATLERINHAAGIDYIVSFLKSNLDTKLVYQKRKLLGDFESIVRQPSESIRGYLNRYERTESQLSAVNIFPDKMYDSEAKGYRLLERARLSPDAQRLVLIGAGYQINRKLMSFPEHKPPPVLHGRDGQPTQRYNHGGKGGKPQQTTTFPNGAAPSKSYGKGGKKGRFSPHRHNAYITEADDQDQIDDQPNDEPDFDPELEVEECVGDEPTYDDHEGDETAPADLAEVADVLTLTAQRNKSIEERKKSSHCSACGVLGHWSGDSVCTKSSKGGKGSKGTRAKPDSRSKGHRDQDAQPKKVLFTVNVPDNHDDNPVNHSTNETIPYYTFMTNYAVNVVFDTFISQESFSGLMILDTACQRTCCGPQWLKSHEKLLHSKNLQSHVTPNSELFQFGRGAPIKSTSRVYLPSIIGDVECLIGAAIVNTQIPLLASNNFLEHMQAVLDFSKGIVILKTIGKTVPLHRISGHLAIEIANFSAGADSSPTWDEFARDSSWDDSQPELVMIVIRLMSLEWTCLRYMSMMVKRGLAHRVWLTLHLRQEEWLRWSDKQQDWLEDGQGPSRKFSLPAPSSAEILLTSTTSYPKFRPALPVTDETDLYLDTMVADDGMDFIETFRVKKRLIGKVNNALHAITKEYQIYQMNSLYCKSRADIMEAFAGSAKISKMSSAYGLKAVTPLDFNTGVDLSTKHGQDICNSLMDRYHPLFFFAEIDCRPWVLLQDNVNFLHRAGFDPDTAVPTTPPEVRMDEPLLPSKRPFDALLNGTMQARLVQNGQFELHNYEPEPLKKLSSRTTSVNLKELHCWARLDVDSNEYQQTMSSGPPWSRVYFRRTIDAKTGEIINQEEAPQQELDIQLPQAMTIITELWHLPQPHECYFVGYEDGTIPMEAGWDGGPETTSPIESSTFFDVYATKLAKSENDTTTTINDDSDVENMAYGESPAAQLTRQQAKALEKELPVSHIMTMPENNIHEFVKAAVKLTAGTDGIAYALYHQQKLSESRETLSSGSASSLPDAATGTRQRGSHP